MSFKDTNYFFGRAMNMMDMERGIEELLVTPNRSVSVKVPLEMEDGQVRVFQGYRVQHNNAREPVEALYLPREAFLERIEAGSGTAYKVAYEIGRIFAGRMATTDGTIAEIVVRLEEPEADRDFDVFREKLVREWSF